MDKNGYIIRIQTQLMDKIWEAVEMVELYIVVRNINIIATL